MVRHLQCASDRLQHVRPAGREKPPGTAANPSFKRATMLLLSMTSLSVLGGCQVIKGIFGVGFGLGALIVVAVVAIIGGIVAMVSRK